MRNLTETEEEELGQRIATILKMQPAHRAGSWETTVGWKTGKGLFRTIQRIMDEIESGSDLKDF